MRKKYLKILFLILCLGVISYTLLFIFFHNSIDRVLKKERQELLIQELQNTKPLPEKVYRTMEKHIPNFFEWNTWNFKLVSLLYKPQVPCQCNELYLPIILGVTNDFPKKWIPLNQEDLVIKLFIEKKLSQKDCFSYHMRKTSFGQDSLENNIIGFETAANYFFSKELEKLTEEEIIGLYLIQKAPTRYNPKSQAYRKAVGKILKK